MEELTESISYEGLLSGLSGYAGSILLLDYDGTLAPFRKERKRAFPYHGINHILSRLISARKVRPVIISGRTVSEIKRFLELKIYPEIWGCHGSERYSPDGTYQLQEISEIASAGLDMGIRAAEAAGLSNFCEEKPTSVALHWRGVPPDTRKKIEEEAGAEWNGIADKTGLEVRGFDGGIELRVPDINKGNVVKTITDSSAGNDLVLYFGDDLTDEDAFRALKGNGFSFLVREDKRETEADFWITPPDELITVLNRILRMSGDNDG